MKGGEDLLRKRKERRSLVLCVQEDGEAAYGSPLHASLSPPFLCHVRSAAGNDWYAMAAGQFENGSLLVLKNCIQFLKQLPEKCCEIAEQLESSFEICSGNLKF